MRADLQSRMARPQGGLAGRVALLELSPPVLAHALDAFPAPVRTLDALHLASCDYAA